MKFEVQRVEFGEWRQWDVRDRPAKGGVYLLAYSRSGTAPAQATPEKLPFEVIYVGNTKDFRGRPHNQHYAVLSYCTKINTQDPEKACLFVAIAELYVKNHEDYSAHRIYAEHIETLLIWNFTQEHGHAPVLYPGYKRSHQAERVAGIIEALGKVVP